MLSDKASQAGSFEVLVNWSRVSREKLVYETWAFPLQAVTAD